MEDWWVGVLYRLVGWGSYRLLMGQGIRFWLVYLVLAGSDWWVAGEGGLWHRVLSYDTWWGCLILDSGWGLFGCIWWGGYLILGCGWGCLMLVGEFRVSGGDLCGVLSGG